MALVESAPAGVLARESNRDARFHQAAESKSFGHTVIHGAFARSHLCALLEQLLYLGMNMETIWIGSQAVRKRGQLFFRQSGFHFELWLVKTAVVLIPIGGQFPHERLLGYLARIFLRGFELGFDGGGLRGGIGGANIFRIDLPQRWMIFDLPVKQWLRDGGIVDFAVTVAAVSDEVD